MSSLPAARRRAMGLIVSAAWTMLAVTIGVPGARATAQTTAAEQEDSVVVEVDTSKTHNVIRQRISTFTELWRKDWRLYSSGSTRSLITSADSATNDMSNVALRRATALSCYSEPSFKLSTNPFVHPIITNPDRGSICLNWLLGDSGTVANEGDAIDLALPRQLRGKYRTDRDRLIRDLDFVQAKNPADTWITGQRLRFAIDQANVEKIITTANSCKGERAQCLALQGLAQEKAGDIAKADSLFHAAQNAVIWKGSADKKGCLSVDELAMFNRGDKQRMRKEPCARQAQLMRQYWWLADPFWSVDGNDRYVAFNARATHATLRGINDRDERYVWQKSAGGLALREMVIRYGWPSNTFLPNPLEQNLIASAMEPPPIVLGPPRRSGSARGRMSGIIGTPRLDPIRIVATPFTAKEYTLGRTAFGPKTDFIFDPFSMHAADWTLYNPRPKDPDSWWPQEHMMFRTKIAPLPTGQEVFLRRESSNIYQLAIDDPLRDASSSISGFAAAALFAGSSDSTTRELASAPIGAGFTLRLKGDVTSQPLVLSAEILPRTNDESALRARYAVRPPPTLREMKGNEFAVTEPLFMRLPNRTMATPLNEADVLRYMAGGLSFAKAEPVAIYWESYGFAPGDTVQVELRVRRDDNLNVARRLGSLLGVASPLRDSISIKWTEPDAGHASKSIGGSRAVVGRSVGLDFGALAPGAYVVLIEMRKTPNISARAERRIVIVDP